VEHKIDDILENIKRADKRIKDAQEEGSKLEGKLEQLKSDLESRFACSSWDKAEELLQGKKEAKEAMEARIQVRYESLVEEHGTLLGLV